MECLSDDDVMGGYWIGYAGLFYSRISAAFRNKNGLALASLIRLLLPLKFIEVYISNVFLLVTSLLNNEPVSRERVLLLKFHTDHTHLWSRLL